MQLFREIGLVSSTLLVIGNILGIGIFTTTGLIVEELGASPWLLGVWLLGGGLALIGAICYSLLSIDNPRAGGEYAFLHPCYGPGVAFLSGWASLLIGFSAPVAASALGFVHYLRPFLLSDWAGSGGSSKLLACLIIVTVCLLVTLGLEVGNWLHSIITLFNLTLALGFAALVLSRAPLRANLTPILQGDSTPDISALGGATILVMFAFSGWNAATYVAEEIRRPGRNIPAALLSGTVLVIGLYLALNSAYLGSVSLSQLSGKIAVAEISAVAILGPTGGAWISLLILFSILSSLTAMSIAGPRVYFAMSRDGLLPGWLSEVDQKRKLPVKSIWFQSGVALVMVGLGSFREILVYSGMILLFFSTLTVSVLFFRQRGEAGRPQLWLLYRLLPGLFIAINTVVLTSSLMNFPRESLAGVLTLLLGLPVYYFYTRRD